MDRIADIWGPRTSHPRGTVWPARVDQHLADGITESDVDRWVLSACLLCSNGCGCDIAVKDGRMVGVRGRATDVVNHGRLGPKGLYGTPTSSTATRSSCTPRRVPPTRGGAATTSRPVPTPAYSNDPGAS